MDRAVHDVADHGAGAGQGQAGNAQRPDQALLVVHHQHRIDVFCVCAQQPELVQCVGCGRRLGHHRVVGDHQAAGSVVLVSEEFRHFGCVGHGLQGFLLLLFGDLLQQVNGHVRVGQVKDLGQVRRLPAADHLSRFFGLQVFQDVGHHRMVKLGQKRLSKFPRQAVQNFALVHWMQTRKAFQGLRPMAGFQETLKFLDQFVDHFFRWPGLVFGTRFGWCSLRLFHSILLGREQLFGRKRDGLLSVSPLPASRGISVHTGPLKRRKSALRQLYQAALRPDITRQTPAHLEVSTGRHLSVTPLPIRA